MRFLPAGEEGRGIEVHSLGPADQQAANNADAAPERFCEECGGIVRRIGKEHIRFPVEQGGLSAASCAQAREAVFLAWEQRFPSCNGYSYLPIMFCEHFKEVAPEQWKRNLK